MLLWLAVATLACAGTMPEAVTAAAATVPPSRACPCSSPALCQPVSVTHAREVFGFSVSKHTSYDQYDWEQLTTVAWNEDPALMCAAHAAGARVVMDGRGANPTTVFGNRTARAAWVAEQVRHAVAAHLDGINFDLEVPLLPHDPLALEYTALVAEAAAAFHAAIPGSQVSVDVPWSPYGVDDRYYDWVGLATAADLVFVMAYDTQSQVWGRCVASANSPLALVRRGLQQWLQVGVPCSKLVLGLPWYGYLYPCISPGFVPGRQDLCELLPVPFTGAPCSDAAGRQVCFSDIAAMISAGGGGRGDARFEATSKKAGGLRALAMAQQGAWSTEQHVLQEHELEAGLEQHSGDSLACDVRYDPQQESPYANCRQASKSNAASYSHQIWFDDPASIGLKCQLAKELGLRGVGVWNLDCLDYQCETPACRHVTAAMWAALRAFSGAGNSSKAGT